MPNLPDNLTAVLQRLAAASRQAGRPEGEVQLIAASKKKPAEAIRQVFAAGQRAFGESYLQEARDKQDSLRDLPIEWHFIGPLQSNKTRPIAEHFDWVHSVDRLKIAQRLSEQRPDHLPALNICLQVNIDGESSKSGVTPTSLPLLAEQVANLPRLRLRGLMAIPAPRQDFAAQVEAFARVRDLFLALRDQHPGLDTLSMGMSGDLEAAVIAGATIVRIGTDIFGTRDS